ncbi:MAG: SemiSWEET family transporter [Candidatus Margulisiibacteriota bacterium]|jgi:uncharacterized protein with PQ loop repeat
MKEDIVNKIGWSASIITTIMFLAYLDQIRLNLADQPGSIMLPLATIINGFFWCTYALLKKKKEWPIFMCNIFGIFIATITIITAII